MKSFHFPLEIVIEARRAQETEQRQQLALALERQRAASTRSREAARTLDQLLQTILTASSERFAVANRERFGAMRQAQEKICAELVVAEHECAQLTEEKRTDVLQARRNRELLERLKAARHKAWEKEVAYAEQHQFDEFAMTRRHQAAQQEGAVC